MRVAFIGVPSGLSSALASALSGLGVEIVDENATQNEEQAADTVQPEEQVKIDGMTDPIIQMRASELTALVNQRDEAIAMAQGERLAHLQYHEGAEEVMHDMRVMGWAGAKFHTTAPNVRWNDLNPLVQQGLIEQAKAELAAFDEAQG